MAKNTKTKLYGAQAVINLGSALELNIPDPVDDRLVVSAETQIWTDAFQFDGNAAYVYHGMQVYAVDTKTTYMYVGPDTSGGPSKSEVQTQSNWRKVSTPQSSVDKIEDNLNKIACAVGISGTASADTFGYSAHTTPSFISARKPKTVEDEVIAIEKAQKAPFGNINKYGSNASVNIVSSIILYEEEECITYINPSKTYSSVFVRFYSGYTSDDIPSEGITLNPIGEGEEEKDKIKILKNYESNTYYITYNDDEGSSNFYSLPIKEGDVILCSASVGGGYDTIQPSSAEFGTEFEYDYNKHNIIRVTSSGTEAYVDLKFVSAYNQLRLTTTNGYKNIDLPGVAFIKKATYSAETETIIITYQTSGHLTTDTLLIPVKGIIEEYEFKEASDNYNVSLFEERSVSGKTQIYAKIDTFDCGTYA